MLRLWATPQLGVQPLTLAGTVAIHENDSQNHQEEAQPGSVLGPKGVERRILSSSHLPEGRGLAHPTSSSQMAGLPRSSSHSTHGLLSHPDHSFIPLSETESLHAPNVDANTPSQSSVQDGVRRGAITW